MGMRRAAARLGRFLRANGRCVFCGVARCRPPRAKPIAPHWAIETRAFSRIVISLVLSPLRVCPRRLCRLSRLCGLCRRSSMGAREAFGIAAAKRGARKARLHRCVRRDAAGHTGRMTFAHGRAHAEALFSDANGCRMRRHAARERPRRVHRAGRQFISKY
ncbi:hypothetical protein UKMD286_1784 [Burkholderia pseudomallei]|nr:hypothetical protein UKMD286_1784 [Burkholderia pseudomallei]